MKIFFIGKESHAQRALDYLKQFDIELITVLGKRGDIFNEGLYFWNGDYILSYLSPWVIPCSVLKKAKYGGINWHPGPPEYPGIGCTNFAVYNNENTYGVTCHFMEEKVDSGEIIEVRRFNIFKADTVYSITQRCYDYILFSFYDIVSKIISGNELPKSNVKWARPPYTRKQLDVLCKIDFGMSEEEIKLRIKATTYNKPWAYTEIKGIKFYC